MLLPKLHILQHLRHHHRCTPAGTNITVQRVSLHVPATSPQKQMEENVFLASTLTPNTGTTGQTRQGSTIANHLSMGELR